jgi:Secretion system C-terminal sorting domain
MKRLYFIPIILLLSNNISWSQCPLNITISGPYATTYTNSNTWIATSGFTTIPTGADVTLDANPLTDGYVFMDVGFETLPNSIFLAVVQTPCALLGIDKKELVGSIKIFPNPANNFININAKSNINKIQITDLNGRIISNENFNSENVSLNLEQLSIGMYLLKIETNNGSTTQKIIKE